ncbi:heme NO-binding domain-containing protein [Shewanella sp. UCD-KL21]|uniref:heme NO-binding domain-containing protein n=1 Tax=Shewanella sp. UCD-KL21 TaxID=1917164 RepID=UPI0009708CB2|nr:heme NO-binding domain-containing protein [Shewanella sp. UCD-KL21]
MKGIIFSEFLELVETTFGLEVCQEILDENGDEGVYTSAGTYDHKDLVKLIISLSKITSISIEELQTVYGKSVFTNLLGSMPELKINSTSTFQFITQVEEYIHLEVKKLYGDAKPPKFDLISSSEYDMVLDYISARCFSHVCFGLIEGCAEYFNEKIDIQMKPIQADGSQVRFTLSKV